MSPEENMGSDEPVKRDAAVAAAATLFGRQNQKRKKGIGVCMKCKGVEMTYLNKVPKTSTLLADRPEAPMGPCVIDIP